MGLRRRFYVEDCAHPVVNLRIQKVVGQCVVELLGFDGVEGIVVARILQHNRYLILLTSVAATSKSE